jgi:hypothetical protein
MPSCVDPLHARRVPFIINIYISNRYFMALFGKEKMCRRFCGERFARRGKIFPCPGSRLSAFEWKRKGRAGSKPHGCDFELEKESVVGRDGKGVAPLGAACLKAAFEPCMALL